MRLIDLHIDGFGRLHDFDLQLSEGMNILYGRNEAGKSTLHAFLQAMLYGLERRPGVGSAAKLHRKYRPWDRPEHFGGQLRLSSDGKVYCIVRDFNADDLGAEACTRTDALPAGMTEPRTGSGASQGASAENAAALRIRNETEDFWISDPQTFLGQLLGGVSETAFENTVSIGQLRSATNRSMVRELKSCIANLSSTGDLSLDAAGALQLLQQQKTALEARRVPEAAKTYAQLIGEIRNIEREIAQPEYENQVRKYQALRASARTEQVDRQTRREELLQKTAVQEAALAQAGLRTEEEIRTMQTKAASLYAICTRPAPAHACLRRYLFLALAVAFGIVGAVLAAASMPGFSVRGGNGAFRQIASAAPLDPTILAIGCFLLAALSAGLFVRRLRAYKASDKELAASKTELTTLLTKQIGSAEVSEEAMTSFRKRMEELLRIAAELREQQTALAALTTELQSLGNDERRYDVELQKQNERQTELEGKLQHLSNVKNRAEMLKHTLSDNDAITEELDAVNLASEIMTELESSIRSSFGYYLNQEAGRLLSGITGGVYDSMWVDQNLDIFMNTPTKVVPIEDVSSGTMDQIYLALRLAASHLVQGAESRLPLIFDDSFAMYDEQRLGAALRFILETHPGQILLFTCHTREARILEECGAAFRRIEL